MAASKQIKDLGPSIRRIGMNPSVRAILAVLALPLAGVLAPTCLVLAAGMLPTAVAFLFDRGREKYLVPSVAMLNFCGVLPALAELWARGQSFAAAAQSLADPFSWVIAYGAAAMGWLLHMGMPAFISIYYERATEARIRHLSLRQKALVEAWGEDVKDGLTDAAAAAEAAGGDAAPATPKYDPAEILGI